MKWMMCASFLSFVFCFFVFVVVVVVVLVLNFFDVSFFLCFMC